MDLQACEQKQPCLHPGCYSHITHPCALCGRIRGYAAYNVVEIFESFQGEGGRQGQWTLFVRFAGCNLSCAFCDTDWTNSMWYSEPELLKRVESSKATYVVFTGGEPTLQPLTREFLRVLKSGQGVMELGLETNGTRPGMIFPEYDYVTVSPKNVHVDLKLITGCHEKPIDEIRLLVTKEGCDFPIFEAIDYVDRHIPEAINDGFEQPYLYLSPVFEGKKVDIAAVEVIRNIVAGRKHPNIRLSVQMHKLLNFR